MPIAQQNIVSEEKKKIFIVGAGGHAKVIIDIVEREGKFDISFLLDGNANLIGNNIFGYTVLGSEVEILGKDDCIVDAGLVAIGNNAIRTKVASWLTDRQFNLVSAIHPSAQIGRGTIIGHGTVVMAGAIINSDSFIGNNVIVNTRASIDHDCNIGDGVHVAPGSTLCGGVSVGAGTFICAGATILPNISIGRDCTISAGAVVINDLPDFAKVMGRP